VARLEQEIAAYQTRIRESDENSAALQYELAAVRQKAENKQQELSQLVDSDFWRITRPLRSLAKSFPGAATAASGAIKAALRLISRAPNGSAVVRPRESHPQASAATTTPPSNTALWSDPKVESLLNSCPAVHGDVTYGLDTDTLRFIDLHVFADSRTLETGSGLSTLLFAYKNSHHTCVTPWQLEATRISRHCVDHGIRTDRLTFAVGSSDEVLPRLLHEGPLDLVLIDGGHGFPLPFVDWLYSAPRLKIGGMLVVDDTHLWTGTVLRDFLSSDPDWKLEASFARGAAFRKINEFRNKEWSEQPYVLKQSKH
jgi:predicted O-methyltransferase YrrM